MIRYRTLTLEWASCNWWEEIMTMSVTAVHNISGCFVILYVLDNNSPPTPSTTAYGHICIHYHQSPSTVTLLLQYLSANQIPLFNRCKTSLSPSFLVSALSIHKRTSPYYVKCFSLDLTDRSYGGKAGKGVEKGRC